MSKICLDFLKIYVFAQSHCTPCSKPLSTMCNEIGYFLKIKKIARTKTNKKFRQILAIFPVLGKMTHMLHNLMVTGSETA